MLAEGFSDSAKIQAKCKSMKICLPDLHLINEEGRMHNFKRITTSIALLAVLAVILWRALPTGAFHPAQANTQAKASATTPIKNVVVIMMENRTFDHMLGRFPGVNGYTEAHAPDPT